MPDPLDDALEATGAEDPRPVYRERLRELRGRDPEKYRQAVEYYERTLVPALSGDGADALAHWLEYGRVLASLHTDGATVQIDRTGRSRPYSTPVPLDHLVLHLPMSTREPAFAVALPPTLSEAQRATLDLLVSRKVG